METKLQKNRGLTRIIFESLLDATAQLTAEGETWSPQVLERLEDELCRRLAPRDSLQNQMIFDMVFRRAFGEAKEQLLELTQHPALYANTPPSPCREALA